MNYIVGYLYLTFEDEEVTYIVFDYIMRNYFARYFENEFEMLVILYIKIRKKYFINMKDYYSYFFQTYIII